MSETQSRSSAASTTGAGAPVRGEGLAPAPTGWVGWVMFAGCVMVLLGVFQAITGLVALLNANYYLVTSNKLVVSIGYTGWGWVHLALGLLLLAAGFGVFLGQIWARIVGMVFAGLSAIVNIGFLAASPALSVVMIALDMVVIYALAVHGPEVTGLRAS